MSADWELEQVSVEQGESALLKQVNLHIRNSEITLIIGSNGAGKSTLLETMAGLRTYTSGSITLGGAPLWLTDKRKPRLNATVSLQYGISLQSSEAQWFSATVQEELLYSLKPYKLNSDEAIERSLNALLRVGLSHELLERDPWTLSGGQQRKLSLACLLACDPQWLLLDEPTAGLDTAGVSALCAVLEAHRALGRGAVVVTHDLDALLPLADAVVIVDDGAVRAATATAAAEHAATPPQAHRALALLRASAALPPEPSPAADSGGAVWPAPRELAAALAEQLAPRKHAQVVVSGAGEDAPRQEGSRQELAVAAASASQPQRVEAAQGPAYGCSDDAHVSEPDYRDEAHVSESSQVTAKPTSERGQMVTAERFDPRMLMLSFFLLSTGIFAGQSMLSLACSAVIVLLLLVPFRALLKPWMRLFRAYGMMLAFFCLIGGVELSPLSFDLERTYPIILRFGKLLLAMLLAMPMLHLMTPMRLQRGIEQTFGWVARFKIPIHTLALLVTLIFRFIPLLAGEWGRFAKVAHARGKASSATGTVPISMLKPLLIPYIRSILRLAEHMADALEARGLGFVKQKPVYAYRLRFKQVDWRMFGISAAASAALWVTAYW